MSTNKNVERICIIAIILCVVIAIVFMNGKFFGIETAAKTMGYETKLFDTSEVHTIDIEMEDWDSFIETAEAEEYSVCNVTIDGEKISNVGIRGKGNTSLSNVSSMGSDRYSFKIEFDQYNDNINYYGLDKLVLNNIIQDSTFMKDYLTYQMMNAFGVSAPLCSFVYITVNGEDWGLYLAVEAIEESFLLRNYGSGYGELYKPDSMDMGGGRGNGRDFDMEDFAENFENAETEISSSESSENNGQIPQTPQNGNTGGFGNMTPPDMGDFSGERPSDFNGEIPSESGGNMPDMQMNFPEERPQMSEESSGSMSESFSENEFGKSFGGGMGSEDVKLQYIDDNFESYSNIFDNAKTDVTDSDKTRLIESLEILSTGENIENAVDIEAVLRYFVVHNYVVNGDSYTGSMVHNYYLYEKDGILSMIPWDYNLAFGTFQGNNANSAINDSIDSPLSVSGNGDRPIADWIILNDEYTELYHRYFNEFLETADIDSIIENAKVLIAPYVEKDPTKFFTYEEFEKGVETLKEFCNLRTESIENQLSQSENSIAVDASHLNLSDMGSMNMGSKSSFDRTSGGRENRLNNNENTDNNSASFNSSMPPDVVSDEDATIDLTKDKPENIDKEHLQNETSSNGLIFAVGSIFILIGAVVFAKLFKR